MTSTRVSIGVATLCLCFAATISWAGGPLVVGGPAVGTRPAFGIDGQPFTWDVSAMPIQYRVDPGPMAISPSGSVVISNSQGLQRVQAMFGVWQGVATARVSFADAGSLLASGAYTGGDLKTVAQFNAIVGSCKSGAQSPVIFDADGSLISGLGLPPEVIGFTGQCALDTANGHFSSALILLNGKMQDGVDNTTSSLPNYELIANQFDEAITHEIGHFLGLDHSQINLDVFLQGTIPCPVDELAGLPLMFAVETCQARKDAGLPLLAPDDVSWISSLYPNQSFSGSYAMISGTIFFGDGISAVQGANIIARLVDDPSTPQEESRRVAVSAVSGYLFTGNPGQSVTASLPDPTENNTNGNPNGSRNPTLTGYYQMFVPPGTYTVEVESLYTGFISDSGIGPLDPPVALPGPAEFWNQNESAFDFPLQRDTITVHAGDKVTGIDIILNTPLSRFDNYEDSGSLWDVPINIVLTVANDERV